MKSESQFESLAESAFNVDKLTLAVSDSQRALDFEKTGELYHHFQLSMIRLFRCFKMQAKLSAIL